MKWDNRMNTGFHNLAAIFQRVPNFTLYLEGKVDGVREAFGKEQHVNVCAIRAKNGFGTGNKWWMLRNWDLEGGHDQRERRQISKLGQ